MKKLTYCLLALCSLLVSCHPAESVKPIPIHTINLTFKGTTYNDTFKVGDSPFIGYGDGSGNASVQYRQIFIQSIMNGFHFIAVGNVKSRQGTTQLIDTTNYIGDYIVGPFTDTPNNLNVFSEVSMIIQDTFYQHDYFIYDTTKSYIRVLVNNATEISGELSVKMRHNYGPMNRVTGNFRIFK